LVFLAFDDNEIIVTYFDGISTTEITVVTGDDKWLMVDEVKGLLDQMVEHPVD
jgi:hypothetical protein